MKTKTLLFFALFSLSLSAQDFSNCIAYTEVPAIPYDAMGELKNYEADYSPVLNMAPSIFNWNGSFYHPVRMRISAISSNRNMIVDFADKKTLYNKIVSSTIRKEALYLPKHDAIYPTDLYIIDMNNNVVFKCNLYWTKTFRINLSNLKPGYYILCYNDQSGYVTRGLDLN